MKKKMIGFIAFMVMFLMTIEGSAGIKVVVSDELKTETAVKSFVYGVISSEDSSTVFLGQQEIAPETITALLAKFFSDLGLDERYTSFQVTDNEEAIILAPLVDMAVIFTMTKDVHDCHECKEDLDEKRLANLDENFESIKVLFKDYVLGDGAVHLGEVMALRNYRWGKEAGMELDKDEFILESTERDLEILMMPHHSTPVR